MTQHHEAWLDDTIVLARDTYTETRCQKKFKFVFRKRNKILKQACRLRALRHKTNFACAERKKIFVGVFHDEPEHPRAYRARIGNLEILWRGSQHLRDMKIVGIASKTLALFFLIFEVVGR